MNEDQSSQWHQRWTSTVNSVSALSSLRHSPCGSRHCLHSCTADQLDTCPSGSFPGSAQRQDRPQLYPSSPDKLEIDCLQNSARERLNNGYMSCSECGQVTKYSVLTTWCDGPEKSHSQPKQQSRESSQSDHVSCGSRCHTKNFTLLTATARHEQVESHSQNQRKTLCEGGVQSQSCTPLTPGHEDTGHCEDQCKVSCSELSPGDCADSARRRSVMGVVSMRRYRQWAGVGLPMAAAFYVVVYCYSALWSSFSLHPLPLHPTLTGSGFRKLLEDQERAARMSFMHTNMSNAAMTQRLPNCIIIGVRKNSTRALLEFLSLHPNIVTAEDEMHFFNDDERYRMGLEWYRHHMPLSLPHQITVEKTPGYFISPITPSRIHRMNSTVKLIVLLRHPTTRTVSDYTQIFYNKQGKNESLDAFEDIAVDPDTGEVNTHYKAVQISMYHHHFRHWLNVFPRHQLHVVDGDRLITDPVSEIERIEDFLGVGHHVNYDLLYYNKTRGFYCMRKNATVQKCLGASKGRKHPDIEPAVIRKLNRFFQPHNKQLFDMIKQWFPWS